MSVAVDLQALAERVGEYGSRAYLVTVADDQHPHVVSVEVALDGDHLVTRVGRGTGSNLRARPAATFLWPAVPGGDYSLIVDGIAVDPEGEGHLTVRPTAAVLHRVAGAQGEGPTCVKVTAT